VHRPDEAPAATLTPAPSDPPSDNPATLAARRLDLNAATQAELELLPGIGPASAKAIVDFRKHTGGFKSLDDLDKVPGIGPKTLDRVRPYLRLGPG